MVKAAPDQGHFLDIWMCVDPDGVCWKSLLPKVSKTVIRKD